MKFNIYYMILLFCMATKVAGGRYKKSGIAPEKCMLLANGNVFWPANYTTPCNPVPKCSGSYKLHKQILGDLRACCCLYRRIKTCPDCDMSRAKKQTQFQWVEMNSRLNGPPDGKCLDGKIKRIFLGGAGKLDKCCCEPPDSPYL